MTKKLYSICYRGMYGELIRLILAKNLFTANEVLQGCLYHVKTLCEVARNGGKDMEEDSIITLVDLDKSLTLTLEEFKTKQINQCNKALNQLNLLRESVIDIVWQSCAAVAEMEGVESGIYPDNGEKKVRIENPTSDTSRRTSRYKLKTNRGAIPLLDIKPSKSDNNKPLYAEIAKWRKILARMASFLKAVDYLLMDLLRFLVKDGVQKLLNHFMVTYHAPDEEEEDKYMLHYNITLVITFAI
ncbi:hypothetical protein LOTGIDRAFT_169210 [Lottia gigantea]|uniref:Uncharacterized protein n=1 Tax=Lottia gigantea TaxID=225164 RepID=V3ZRL1_LOTGI|nr:hypothetical protein LOTGIDRAFT_169210 [Lottia gigantea]ESO83516.1 hypothetical protein LOTGIDRAFT_169210 [Lottia gigantea]